ncbi:hypothetical protein [Williamsia sp. D3]|uniref:hypothetical protein n=1 Tax=Williamsia sp. D3 TaxID=1313067 RepID=UPI0003D3A40F|nr:hypothetical protein [Williamsia sp. D3]ETD33148.1 hypothetical protein W823_08485 [Williamsia sp. D3]
MRTALLRLAGPLVIATGAVVTLSACGGDNSTAPGNSSTAQSSGSAATGSSSPAEPGSTSSRTPSTENSNAPAVPGPSLPPATSIPDSKRLPAIEGVRCETVNGPDGALQVVIFAGSGVDCAAVMPVAKEYGPKIATGTPQQVSGWDCGPSQTRGVLSRCTRGSDAFGFAIE